MARTRNRIVTATANLVASQRARGAGTRANIAQVADTADTYEAARRQRAARLGCAMPDPFGDLLAERRALRNDTQEHAPRPVRFLSADCPRALDNAVNAIRSDIEMDRICFGLKLLPLLQRYLPLHEEARQTGLQGFTIDTFHSLMRRYAIKGCDAYNLRLLRRGHGLFWNLHGGMVYPVGYVELCHRIVEYAASLGLYDLFITNGVGEKRDYYIDVSGSNHDFEAAVLNGWILSRDNPTISREVMSLLFNRDVRTLRKIERHAGIQVVENIAETADPANVPLRANGELRTDVYRTIEQGRTIWHFHLPNTYISTTVKQHHRRGQSRRASVQFNQWIDQLLPGTSPADGVTTVGKLNRLARIYCENDDVARQSRQRGNAGVLYVPDKPGDSGGVVWKVYRDIV